MFEEEELGQLGVLEDGQCDGVWAASQVAAGVLRQTARGRALDCLRWIQPRGVVDFAPKDSSGSGDRERTTC